MWKFRDIPLYKMRIYPTLTNFFFQFFLSFHFQYLSRYMCGYNLTMKIPPDFYGYTALNGLVNSFSWFTIAPPNKLILGCKPLCLQKNK